jgi:rhodanese-related sulfurtransferase
MKVDKTALGVLAVTLVMAGGAPARAWATAPGVVAKSTIGGDSGAKHELSAIDLKAKLDKKLSVVIIDARTDLNGQIIKGAIHVPLSSLEEWARSADKNAVIVTYCTCPHDEAADAEMNKLRELGFENAFTLTGGLDAARKAGLEVIAPGE